MVADVINGESPYEKTTEAWSIRIYAMLILLQNTVVYLAYSGWLYPIGLSTIAIFTLIFLNKTRPSKIGTDYTPFLSHYFTRAIFGSVAMISVVEFTIYFI